MNNDTIISMFTTIINSITYYESTSTYQDSSKWGAVETGCSDLYDGIH